MSQVALPFRLHLRIAWTALVLWCVCATTAPAEIRVTPWRAAFQGVELADGTADAAEPRIQRVFAARIQLDSPGLKFFSTPRAGTLETLGETASTFLNKHRLQLAINANFYEPVSNTPVDINLEGLAISERTVVSPPSPSLPALCLTEDNHARFVENTPANFPTAGIATAIAGSRIILRDGRPTARSSTPDDVHPRTAVGLSHDGRVLIWLVIDGRQPGYSLGASVEETALWLARLGAHSGLLLDGGGSTTLVRADRDGRATLLNRPIHKNTPGRERLNGNHLGLRAAPLPPAVPSEK